MREILFRGKQEQSGEWVYGNLVQYIPKDNNKNTENYILTQEEVHHTLDLGGRIECDMESVVAETVGQYTGLCDKHGKKIFEGDICDCNDGVNHYIAKVVEDVANPDFVLAYKNKLGYDDIEYDFIKGYNMSIEVIGNIFDNPELISDQTN